MPWATYSIPPRTRVKTTHGVPRESWWCCPEADFTLKASDELRRMKTSKFGSIQLGTESEARADRRRRLPV